ncbi:MAG: hypothetical protein M9939_18875 [Mesorhizobium sp.]|nr:hypothetical protein [Mesorhizobium sp.]MCO5163203.1 hypothetical protein [Mesorhizobium sp.]
MTRKRRMRWKGLAVTALVAAGATATVAIAQTAGGMGGAGGPDRRAEWCTRYVSLGLAASEGIRQGRAEQVANDRMVVFGRLRGASVKMTLENAADACRVVRIEML